MQTQLKTVRSESKVKASSKVSDTTDELQYLMSFNASITEFVFISMGNLTLARRDTYLTSVKNGRKTDTLSPLMIAPLQIAILFQDSVIKRAEEGIAQCFLCYSIVLCKSCNKCQKCCLKSACRGKTSKLLTNLTGSGCRSESCWHLKNLISVPAPTSTMVAGGKQCAPRLTITSNKT